MNWIPFATPHRAWFQTAFMRDDKPVMILAWRPVWDDDDDANHEREPYEIEYLTDTGRIGTSEDVTLEHP